MRHSNIRTNFGGSKMKMSVQNGVERDGSLQTFSLCVFSSSFLNVTTSNILDMELAPEGTVINVSCSCPNQV